VVSYSDFAAGLSSKGRREYILVGSGMASMPCKPLSKSPAAKSSLVIISSLLATFVLLPKNALSELYG
jgi:hypothetical protein